MSLLKLRRLDELARRAREHPGDLFLHRHSHRHLARAQRREEAQHIVDRVFLRALAPSRSPSGEFFRGLLHVVRHLRVLHLLEHRIELRSERAVALLLREVRNPSDSPSIRSRAHPASSRLALFRELLRPAARGRIMDRRLVLEHVVHAADELVHFLLLDDLLEEIDRAIHVVDELLGVELDIVHRGGEIAAGTSPMSF